jgi:hypothetical protein
MRFQMAKRGGGSSNMVGLRLSDEEIGELDKHVSEHLGRAAVARIIIQGFMEQDEEERAVLLSERLFRR